MNDLHHGRREHQFAMTVERAIGKWRFKQITNGAERIRVFDVVARGNSPLSRAVTEQRASSNGRQSCACPPPTSRMLLPSHGRARRMTARFCTSSRCSPPGPSNRAAYSSVEDSMSGHSRTAVVVIMNADFCAIAEGTCSSPSHQGHWRSEYHGWLLDVLRIWSSHFRPGSNPFAAPRSPLLW